MADDTPGDGLADALTLILTLRPLVGAMITGSLAHPEHERDERLRPLVGAMIT